MEGRGYSPATGTVPLANRPENIAQLVDVFRSHDPRWGALDSAAARTRAGGSYAPLKDRFHQAAIDAASSMRTYDLILIGTETLSYQRLSDYIDRGAEYVVVEKDRMERMIAPQNAVRFPQAARFYQDVASGGDLELLRQFDPRGGPGPVLLLYRVRPAGEGEAAEEAEEGEMPLSRARSVAPSDSLPRGATQPAVSPATAIKKPDPLGG
jgi:hypothetical protein